MLEKIQCIKHERSKSHSRIKRISSAQTSTRKKSNDRIYRENRLIVNKLLNQSSFYSQARFKEDRKAKESILKRIGDYPYPSKKSQRTISRNFLKKKPLFSRKLQINGNFFDLEIHKKNQNMLIVALSKGCRYKLSIPFSYASRIMGDSIENLIRKISFQNGNLVLTQT